MENCLFCKIANGEIPCKKVYEDENVLAFEDIAPQAPVHVLIIPKTHAPNILELADKAVLVNLIDAVKHIANQLGVAKSGFRIAINTGKDGGQTVEHLHLHLLGSRELGWPPG